MIQKIQSLFHTDKWWGKILFVFCFYVVFFFLGYWIWLLVPRCLGCDYPNFIYYVSPIYFFIILPILSFIFIYKIKKILNLKTHLLILFLLNFILIILNIALLIFILIKNFEPHLFL